MTFELVAETQTISISLFLSNCQNSNQTYCHDEKHGPHDSPARSH